MTGQRSWNGDSEPLNGAEDGVPFTEEDGGSEPRHGLYQSPDDFFQSNPDAQEMRDELVEKLMEDCAHPDRQEHIIERYATLFVKLEYAQRNLEGITEDSGWDRLGTLETKTQRWYDRIDWQEDEERADKKADGAKSFFDALDAGASDDDESDEQETIFDP